MSQSILSPSPSTVVVPAKPDNSNVLAVGNNDQQQQPPSSLFYRIQAALLYEPLPGENPPLYLFYKNRYVRACVFCLMCLCNTLVYFGWQHFSSMLYRSGAYLWECPTKTVYDKEYDCDAQKNSVQALFQIGICTEFICGVLAGISLDRFGPLLTACIGCCSYLTGWMFLIYSCEAVTMYIPGMLFLGGAVNFIAFPSFCLQVLFPKRSGLVISLVVAAQCAGTSVAVIMSSVWDSYPLKTYQEIIWGYLFCAFFPVTLLYLLCVPWQPISVPKSVSASDVADTVDTVASSSSSVTVGDSIPLSSLVVDPEMSSSKVFLDVSSSKALLNSDQSVTEAKDATIVAGPDEEQQLKVPLYREVFSRDYALFALYFVLQGLQFGYYPAVVSDYFDNSISTFLGYLMPTQGLWGALFGLLVDKTTTLPICVLLVVMMTLAYGTAMIPSAGLQYLTALLYVVSNSFYYTVKCTFVEETFSPSHYGRLIGIIGCIAGAIGLLNIPIQNANNFIATSTAYIVVGILAGIIVVILLGRKKRKLRAVKMDCKDAEVAIELSTKDAEI